MRLPEGWQFRKVGYACYVKARIGWQGLRSSEFTDAGPLLVTGTDFENGRIDWDRCYHVSEERYQEDPYIHLQEGDLLITKDGTIGKVAVVEGLPGPATLNSGIFVVRPVRRAYDSRFLRYVLCSSVFSGFVDYRSSGTTINHLYQNVFVDFMFGCPDDSQQAAIVEWLDERACELDALIAKKQRLIDLLEEKRAALTTHAVTRGLEPGAPTKDSGVESLGRVPAHWEVRRLKFGIAALQQGWSPECEGTQAGDGEWGVLKAGCCNRGTFDPEQNKHLPTDVSPDVDLEIHPGDVVMSRASGSVDLIGSVAVVPGDCRAGLLLSDKLYRLVAKARDPIEPEYLAMLLGSHPARMQLVMAVSGASGLANNIGQPDVRNVVLPWPPTAERVAIYEGDL